MKEFIDKLIGRLEAEATVYRKDSDKEYKQGTYEQAKEDMIASVCLRRAIQIVNQLAEEYNNGWIPFSTDSKLPKEGHRCWLSFTTPATSYVKSAWYIEGHFEWDNGRKVKETPLAWKPYYVPQPYQPKGE